MTAPSTTTKLLLLLLREVRDALVAEKKSRLAFKRACFAKIIFYYIIGSDRRFFPPKYLFSSVQQLSVYAYYYINLLKCSETVLVYYYYYFLFDIIIDAHRHRLRAKFITDDRETRGGIRVYPKPRRFGRAAGHSEKYTQR